jgi:hypothetical protein
MAIEGAPAPHAVQEGHFSMCNIYQAMRVFFHGSFTVAVAKWSDVMRVFATTPSTKKRQ